ncbi:Holliday junction resolvase RecU [Aerococcaceae bacterium NML160702]|nr:Holliday junction resolvase RecU [Aerococcaceae bacterium NML191219]MCW6675215.1 Holliday junction resolvase RecU [Aerococcaceae bacterium NML171108]MCW6680802.1 Holliday junction resolvase RecU [Aerococcaceae bacterium NML130460]MCW6682178.1 Holliday junction resolvase RecU [Aerococcaceae bacterium NML160702]
MLNYPAGHRPIRNTASERTTVNYGSRGMSLEERLNLSNEYYITRQIAVIHKKPTPVQVVKVDYPKRSAARIVEAYYRHASTTDYNGVYKGYYIDFEAKETTNKTRFPLANLPQHQIEHMRQCAQQGGVVFLILSFKVHQTVFLLPFSKLENYLADPNRKSISIHFLEEHAYQCQLGLFPHIDYLKEVDKLLLSSNSERS